MFLDDDGPEVCVTCGRSMMRSYAEECQECQDYGPELQDEMTPHERARYCALQIQNGNLLDAIDVLMRDGDVRVESITAALHLTTILVEQRVQPTQQVTDLLIRLIDQWETQL